MENNFSKNLSAFMQERMVSQSALARSTGLSQAAISRYIKGLACPAAADLFTLSQFFGVSMDTLWNAENEPQEDRTGNSPLKAHLPPAEPTAAEIELAELKRSLQIVFRAMSEPLPPSR